MKKTIITISRQFGSGGRIIGQKLAEELQIPFYDKEIINQAVEESGISKEVFEKESDKTSRGFYLLGAIGYAIGSPITITPEMSLNDRIFQVEADVINEFAQEGSCVIVGRCADYILDDYDEVINVYIHADLESRVNRVLTEYNVSPDDILDMEEFIKKVDKQRANYYNYYTNRTWGHVENYDIVLNSSRFTIDECVSFIKQAVLKEE